MWLLHAKQLKLEYFQGSNTPEYAILSHRWQDGEVTFDDMNSRLYSYRGKKGWQKILGCCKLAVAAGIEYIWVDTCCIDKRSSAELSEAINSMYEWYKSAYVCYAYLFDVHSMEDLAESSWFLRSWTLQELLAPETVIFLDSDWREIGTRLSLWQEISAITAIPCEALIKLDITQYSIAQRMCWAARRVATRTEDLAYSILGILDINMPLLYGEGEKAFQRLQEAVMQNSNDLSLFAWTADVSCARNGMLARSPEAFSCCADVEQLTIPEGYTTNNAGVTITLLLRPWYVDARKNTLYRAMTKNRNLCLVLGRNMYVSFDEVVLIGYLTTSRSATHVSDNPTSYSRGSGSARVLSSWRLHPSYDWIEEQVFIDKIPLSIDTVSEMTRFRIDCPTNALLYLRAPFWKLSNRKPNYEISDSGQWQLRENKGFTLFDIPAPDSYGMVGYLTWPQTSLKGLRKRTLVVCFGHNFSFEPICLAFYAPSKFCFNPLLLADSSMVMHCHRRLLNDKSTEDICSSSDLKLYAIRGRHLCGYLAPLDLLLDMSRNQDGTFWVDFSSPSYHADRHPTTNSLPGVSGEAGTMIYHLFRTAEPGVRKLTLGMASSHQLKHK